MNRQKTGGILKKFLGYLLVILLALVTTTVSFLPIKKAMAYDANNLISDADFINWRALDVSRIQQFLNTRGGTQLRNFSEGNRSAAQIIADASRANGINPYVILATIQKEESIVDSNYHFDQRVVWAMGYGVCDSCSLDDPDVVRYRGFTNQIDNGAWQLKHNYSYWAANGSEWNVGRTMIIDDAAIRFANRATSALYRYTPHLHGNENFNRIYNNYRAFGTKGTAVKGTTDKSKLSKSKSSKSKSSKSKSSSSKSRSKASTAGQSAVAYDALYLRQAAPANLAPGQQRTIYAYFKNSGSATWINAGANPVYLGSSSPQDRGSVFTAGRNMRWRLVTARVLPGRVGAFALEITAPAQTGQYTEKFRPLQEGVTWFGPEVTFNFNVGGTAATSKKR